MAGRRKAIYIVAAIAILAVCLAYAALPSGITSMQAYADNEPVDDSVELYEGTETAFSFTITPESFADRKIEFHVVDESIATVDEEGIVSALSEGETLITAEAAGFKKKINVKVNKAVLDIEGLEEDITLYAEDTEELTPKVKMAAEGLKAPQISYKSADENIATVSDDGTVTGVDAGETIVTVSAGDISKEVKVTVENWVVVSVPTTSSGTGSSGRSSGGSGGNNNSANSGGGSDDSGSEEGGWE